MSGHHPSRHAQTTPDHLALVIADTGETLTYRELDEGSNRVAHLLRAQGLRPGDRIGVMMRNSPEFCMVYWGATRSGLYVTLLSTHLKPAEAAYIVTDSNAKLLILSAEIGETPAALGEQCAALVPSVTAIFHAGPNPVRHARSLSAAMADMPTAPLPDEISGFHMIYSSGTTGRPKGVVMSHVPGAIDQFNLGEGSPAMFAPYQPLVALNAGPLYHGAPLSTMIVTQRLGGTFVTQRKFDAAGLLDAISRYRVTTAHFVPTMFVRLLALPDATRAAADLSSLQCVVHAAAPCAVEIKRRMIDWCGPIVFEYYGSTEAVGATAITSEEWLRKPGSVGKSSLGPIHICDDEGRELPCGEAGVIWFEALPGRVVNYHNDPEKTKRASHPRHADWFTVGDLGRLDEDGYLFLTDRKDFMIISGGVNIYPQAIEDCLIVHPAVLDVAVIGLPDAEYGEEVVAIVQPKVSGGEGDGNGLEVALRAWCAERISPVTAPRRYVFVDDLPRLPSGKLAKHELRKAFSDRTP